MTILQAAERWADAEWEKMLRVPGPRNHFRDLVNAFTAGAQWAQSEEQTQKKTI